MSKIIQVNVLNFFYFAKIQKKTKLGPKKRFWDLKIKINPSGSNPTKNPIEPPKFNQGSKSFNKDISRTISQILKI